VKGSKRIESLAKRFERVDLGSEQTLGEEGFSDRTVRSPTTAFSRERHWAVHLIDVRLQLIARIRPRDRPYGVGPKEESTAMATLKVEVRLRVRAMTT
jgi:hypothetical protein